MKPRERVIRIRDFVRASNGVSVSDVAAVVTDVSKGRVASDLKMLVMMGEIYMGGDKRFARYASSPEAALAASEHARKTAPGPIFNFKKPDAKITGLTQQQQQLALLTEIRDDIRQLLRTWLGMSQ